MKNNIKIFAPFVLAILIGSLTFAFAQNGKSSFNGGKNGNQFEHRMPPNGLNPRILDQLNLTDAQKEQIQAIQNNSRDTAKEDFDKVRAYDEQLRTLVESGNFNEDAARQILNTKAQAMVEAKSSATFGAAKTDLPVQNDYDGDGETDTAVWRETDGTFYILKSADNSVSSTQWGFTSDVPLVVYDSH